MPKRQRRFPFAYEPPSTMVYVCHAAYTMPHRAIVVGRRGFHVLSQASTQAATASLVVCNKKTKGGLSEAIVPRELLSVLGFGCRKGASPRLYRPLTLALAPEASAAVAWP